MKADALSVGKCLLTCLDISSGQLSRGTEVDTDEFTLEKKETCSLVAENTSYKNVLRSQRLHSPG